MVLVLYLLFREIYRLRTLRFGDKIFETAIKTAAAFPLLVILRP